MEPWGQALRDKCIDITLKVGPFELLEDIETIIES